MRHSTANRRQRNRGGGGRNGGGNRSNNPRVRVFDSNGPDVRIRGTAHQVAEKYRGLAKDAASGGDRSIEENYLQHAEHYQRIINDLEESVQAQRNASMRASSDSSDSKDERPQETVNKVDDEDLSLPASILGDSPKAKSEVRASELSAT